MQPILRLFSGLKQRLHYGALALVDRWRLIQITRQIAARAAPQRGERPVVFFNASSRLHGLSLNAAFSLLASWGLRLAGVPVVHFVCNAGMSRCVLGTDRYDHTNAPPCKSWSCSGLKVQCRSNPEAMSLKSAAGGASGPECF